MFKSCKGKITLKHKKFTKLSKLKPELKDVYNPESVILKRLLCSKNRILQGLSGKKRKKINFPIVWGFFGLKRGINYKNGVKMVMINQFDSDYRKIFFKLEREPIYLAR